MCKWLPLANSELMVCFACLAVQSQAGFLASTRPVKLIQVANLFWPEYCVCRRYTAIELSVIGTASVSKELITDTYKRWVANLIVE